MILGTLTLLIMNKGRPLLIWDKNLKGQGHIKTFNFLVRRDESPENYCHSSGVGGVVVVVVRRQKL